MTKTRTRKNYFVLSILLVIALTGSWGSVAAIAQQSVPGDPAGRAGQT